MNSDYGAAATAVTRVAGVVAACVVDAADGLVVAEAMLEGGRVDSAAVAALAAALATRLQGPVTLAGLGPVRLFQLEAGEGLLVVSPAPGELLLAAVARPSTNLGLLRLALVDAAERLV